jgi:Flp pilus assembly protein TadB
MAAGVIILLMAFFIIGYLVIDELTLSRPGWRQTASAVMTIKWQCYIPALLGLVFAVLMALPSEQRLNEPSPTPPILICGYILVAGILFSLYLIRRSQGLTRGKLDRQVAQLVDSFHSIYQLKPTIFSALDEAKSKVDEPLRGYITAAVQAFYITARPDKALEELRRRANNPYIDQFIYILRISELGRREAVLKSLDDLSERLRRADNLRRDSEVNLTVITSQTRIIQVISLAIVLIIAVIPMLRSVYTVSWGRQLLFIAVASIGVLTSYYIDQQVVRLKERIL